MFSSLRVFGCEAFFFVNANICSLLGKKVEIIVLRKTEFS
jgi:hypothetical protein